ncbi:MAG: 50S ribosomal protein L5 [Candidatus Omnitrophota bacterium]|nr:MAG: 50S ribosomal protein L5 [Candidatus Omnitrophota bacterium]RKY45142.1 MAG: 50S ribosomal protein L5 [Candidatus Omnitrophota bacterium]
MQKVSERNLEEKYIPRLLKLYREEVVPKMMEEFKYKNKMQVPRLLKIVINMGIGEATSDPKLVEKAAEELALITGQRPKVTRARKPISNFKLKKGMAIGCCVTLRKARMYEFLDRLITTAIPRIKDFRGLSPHSFDGKGNYNFGLSEQTVFPEVNIDKVERTQGMNITICTSSRSNKETYTLLKLLGFPFKR